MFCENDNLVDFFNNLNIKLDELKPQWNRLPRKKQKQNITKLMIKNVSFILLSFKTKYTRYTRYLFQT